MAATRLLLNVCLRKAIHQTTRDRTPETLVAASHWFVGGSYFQTFLVIYLLYSDDLPGHLHKDISVLPLGIWIVSETLHQVNATSIIKTIASMGRIGNSLHQVNATSMAKPQVGKHS